MNKEKLGSTFARMHRNSQYRVCLWVLGFFTMLVTFFTYKSKKSNNRFAKIQADLKAEFERQGLKEQFYKEALLQIRKKNEYFKKNVSESDVEKEARRIAEKNLNQYAYDRAREKAAMEKVEEISMVSCYESLIANPAFFAASVVLSFPMYLLMLVYVRPIAKYITERLFLMIFVLFGVTWLVFTILYIAPMDPATNLLGQTATQEQIDNFNKVYGLDQPYLTQLVTTFKNLITFNLGNSFEGNENVVASLLSKFPITLTVAFWSMMVALIISVPAGIISAIKPYSTFDYAAMFIALLGLSIPNFWLGLMLILQFAIRLGWLPATFQPGRPVSLIIPAIVIGTGMSASIARMTRSSMLEVKNSDYILTARSKGLVERKVVLKHILGNAMIPIITMVGMSFSNLMGGAAVTEKVSGINGIGSYIVAKQFIPDIPVVLGGVVYVSFIVSIMNLLIDILYAMIDPRIKSKMKNY